MAEPQVGPRQQDDLFKDLMTWLTSGGLRYACAKHSGQSDPQTYYQQKVTEGKQKRVIIVGAGMAGLSAAYEMAQIGHKVTILEIQSRVGGRVKTFREGFQDGLHSEGGAMRVPASHYLTQHYISHFNLATKPFQNSQDNAYMYIFGTKIKMKEFRDNNGKFSDLFWPGWDANLTDDVKRQLGITGISTYLYNTIAPVVSDLPDSPTEQQWQTWIDKWSKLSIEDFLRGTMYQAPDEPQLRPWPEAAINGYKSFSNNLSLEPDLVSAIRGEIGQWHENTITVAGGMDMLPKAFMKLDSSGWNQDVDLSKNIVFGLKVESIEISHANPDMAEKTVKVMGQNKFTGAVQEFTGDAVFVTVPLHVMRQIDMPLSTDQQKAMINISYIPVTKIMLQCRTRFWQKDVGQGGYTRTNTLLNQLYYPDFDGSGIPDDERGILLVYSMSNDALTLSALSENEAVKEAVREVAEIHPEVLKEFEVGRVQAWTNDPASQGAFAALKPYEYLDSMKALKTPSPPIYLAGEAISWSNGWMQGAVFSGLIQAFLFQSREEGFGDIDPMNVFGTKI